MNKIVKLALILFLISAIVAGILGGVYIMTKDPIAQYEKEKTAKAYMAVLPDIGDLEAIAKEDYPSYIDPESAADVNQEVSINGAKLTILKSTVAEDGKTYVVEVKTTGSQGIIVTVVGVDSETGTCTSISIKTSSETSGLGAEASKPYFAERLQGKDANTCLTTKEKGEVDALTGATITSKAVTRSVKAAIEYVAGIA